MQEFSLTFESFRTLFNQVGLFLPRLGVAAVVLVGGWIVAKAFRFSVVKALRALNFHVLTERAGTDRFLQQGGSTKDTTELFGWIGYLLVILASLIIAFNSLGLTQVTDLLGRVLLFVPRLLVALFVIVLGSYFARFAGNAVQAYCRASGIGDGEILGRFMQYGVMAFVVLLAVDHLDIGGGLIQRTFLILLGGVVVALALAFGLGGRERAAHLIERWFPREPQGDDGGPGRGDGSGHRGPLP